VNLAKPPAAAPLAFPAWLVRLRGLLAVLVAVAFVLGAPGLAYGAFTATTTASLRVGTYKIPAPASLNGTLQCTNTGRGASITIAGFGLVDRATGYTARLTLSGGTPTVVPVPVGSSVTITNWDGRGKYTFSLTARVGSWTGEPLQRTVTC